MCAACIEYTKDKLTTNEFKAALRETTAENPAHLRDVERVLRENASRPPEELKQKLRELDSD